MFTACITNGSNIYACPCTTSSIDTPNELTSALYQYIKMHICCIGIEDRLGLLQRSSTIERTYSFQYSGNAAFM